MSHDFEGVWDLDWQCGSCGFIPDFFIPKGALRFFWPNITPPKTTLFRHQIALAPLASPHPTLGTCPRGSSPSTRRSTTRFDRWPKASSASGWRKLLPEANRDAMPSPLSVESLGNELGTNGVQLGRALWLCPKMDKKKLGYRDILGPF